MFFFVFVILLFFYLGFDYFIKVLVFVEFMSITLILFYFILFDLDFVYFSIYFLIFGVCEGVLGLSVLAMVVCWYGNDYIGVGGLVY